MPTVRTALKGAGLPGRFFSYTVQVEAEKCGFDVLAKFARRFVPAKGNDADRVALGRLPFAVKPRSRDNKIRVVGIVLRRVPKNLPGPPRIFLIPEAGYVEIWHRRSVQLPDPGFFLPEVVVIRVFDTVIPVGNFAVKIFLIDIRERAKV